SADAVQYAANRADGCLVTEARNRGLSGIGPQDLVDRRNPCHGDGTRIVHGLTTCSVSKHLIMTSVAYQEEVFAAAPPTLSDHQHIESQGRNVIGHRLESGILDLIEDLHITAALVAGLGLHRIALT